MNRPPGFTIPPEFWQGLTDEEYRKICDTSELDRQMCRRLWHMLGFPTKPPRKLMVLVHEDDVNRLINKKREIH